MCPALSFSVTAAAFQAGADIIVAPIHVSCQAAWVSGAAPAEKAASSAGASGSWTVISTFCRGSSSSAGGTDAS